MKQKALWINQIKGLCICLVVVYHSVITFYPHLGNFQHPWSQTLSKCWVYFNLYLAPFRMPVFFFISGLLIQRYINELPWQRCIEKRVWNIIWVLALWGVLQWQALSHINLWLAPDRRLSASANAAYADGISDFIQTMLTANTSLWYLYALVVYFMLCKFTRRNKTLMLALFALLSIAINVLPTPWWGMNSVARNLVYYALGSWYGAQLLDYLKAFNIRRDWLPFSLLTLIAVALWFCRTPFFLSLVSIFTILKLFYAVARRYPPAENNLLNIIGSNTIAIYTTHRILVEIASLWLARWLMQHRVSPALELALIALYPAASLLLCVLAGLLARHMSKRIAGDILFSPPTLPVAGRT